MMRNLKPDEVPGTYFLHISPFLDYLSIFETLEGARLSAARCKGGWIREVVIDEDRNMYLYPRDVS